MNGVNGIKTEYRNRNFFIKKKHTENKKMNQKKNKKRIESDTRHLYILKWWLLGYAQCNGFHTGATRMLPFFFFFDTSDVVYRHFTFWEYQWDTFQSFNQSINSVKFCCKCVLWAFTQCVCARIKNKIHNFSWQHIYLFWCFRSVCISKSFVIACSQCCSAHWWNRKPSIDSIMIHRFIASVCIWILSLIYGWMVAILLCFSPC